MKPARIAFLFLHFLAWTLTGWAQESDPSVLTLDRIFNSSDFVAERFGPAHWLDGSGYTTLEASPSYQGTDMIRYDAETGQREVLVSAERLIPDGFTAPLNIENYVWSQDGRKLLIFTNSRRVWRQNTRGDYWVLDLDSWALKKLGEQAAPSTLMFAKFAPDGRSVGYVCLNNIYVESLEDGAIIPLTNDGSETVINGTFDWVYEEEFGLRDGFRWSPDGQSVAYWQLDAEGVGEFYMINNTDSIYSTVIPVQYPKVGTTNSAGRVGVVSADGGSTRWFEVPGDPRNNYIARMEWAESSDEVVIQHLNRLQNTNNVLLGDARTGSVRTILTDRDDAWLRIVDDLNWLNNGAQFTWVSERDGWQHVYLVSRSGDTMDLVTPGEYDVISIELIDEEGGWLYYIASPDNPTQRYLFRTRLDGRGAMQRLTPVDSPGTHSYQIAPGAGWAIHSMSNIETPGTTRLVRLPDHSVVRGLAENEALRRNVASIRQSPTEFFRVDIGEGVVLDGWLIKPSDFDHGKKYPVLIHVYGEPAGQTVLDRWGGTNRLWHLMLAQWGYIVMSVDNRGTPAPRGRAWRKIVYRQIGILASKDQAAAVEKIVEWPFVDPDRIAIWGWSGGGSMSLNMIFRYPGLYHTAMSVAPVTNQRYYDTIYQERYMGLPADNERGFREGSPITYAHQLEGNLLIVHGIGDDNVHYQSTEALVNELIAHNKHFTMMAYPNRSHGIYEGSNTRRHLYGLLTRYLNENIPVDGSR